jgi:arsenite methyltransferase
MKRSLLDLLVDPIDRSVLSVETKERTGNSDLLTGYLTGASGQSYAIVDGIPRFVQTTDQGQLQTAGSFSYKWRRRSDYESDAVRAFYDPWLLSRYGFASNDQMQAYFGRHQRILDAGCGSGFSSQIWVPRRAQRTCAEWVLADVSAAIDVARERLGDAQHIHYLQADILQLPFRPGSFDLIISEGVLHHTPSTEAAFKCLVPLLTEGGEIMVYVYRKKAPLREFADDYIRQQVAQLNAEAAWEAMRSLTVLGQRLAELHATVDVPDVPLLGIAAGTYDVQRLLYWNFVKAFWNPTLDFEMNNLINFDWYHPTYAHRHTEEECRRWCHEASLSVTHFNTEDSGFTFRASKARSVMLGGPR